MVEFQVGSEYFIVTVSSRREFKETELLLLSRSITHIIQSDPPVRRFLVPLERADFARKEIELYFFENRNWPPPPAKTRDALFQFSPSHLIVVLGLAYFHWMTNQLTTSVNWLEKGKFSADRILSGEWERTVTALTLHLDDPHFLSNFFGLLFFVTGVNQFAGGGVSWLLVLVSGILGNSLNAFFYETAHEAVGASTAVFGAVGIMGALGVKQYIRAKQFRTRFFVPVIGSLGILAMLGTNIQTDVMAHFFGFISGLGIGLVLIPFSESKFLRNSTFQGVSFAIFAALIFFSWKMRLAG